jgi:hypothetical protein
MNKIVFQDNCEVCSAELGLIGADRIIVFVNDVILDLRLFSGFYADSSSLYHY